MTGSKKLIRSSTTIWLVLALSGCCQPTGKHLFILSGQSNMAGLDPDLSFVPAVVSAFGEDNIIVVKDAHSGQPIRRWYIDWQPGTGTDPAETGDLYDSMMAKVFDATAGLDIQTVTFLWMQGERDARESHGDVYARSLQGLFTQLENDLDRSDLNVVIGRLSDFDMRNERYPHWTMVREAQVAVANTHPRGVWINTDDLNDGFNRAGAPIANDLHYSVDGYRIFGKRLADAATSLVTGK